MLLVTSHSSTGIQTDSAPPSRPLYLRRSPSLHPRNFFSPQGGRSSYVRNRTIRPHRCP
nr:unnamed protein product [Callosobruchus chinensis]CAH7754389.1 unnamed protein product [Callosobruchus chinensis]